MTVKAEAIVQRREAGTMSLSDMRFNPARPQDAKEQLEACLTDHQRIFVECYLSRESGCYLNKSAAGRIAWPDNELPYQSADKAMKTNPALRMLIQWHLCQHGLGRTRGLNQLAGWIYDVDLADFEPYMDGKLSLSELKAAGIDIRAVKSVKIHRDSKGGITRSLELLPKDSMIRDLLRAVGAFETSQAAAAPPPVVNHQGETVYLVRETTVTDELRAGRHTPTAPGVPVAQFPAGNPTPEYVERMRLYVQGLQQQLIDVDAPPALPPVSPDITGPIGRTAEQYPQTHQPGTGEDDTEDGQAGR